MLTSIKLKNYTTFINETIFDFKATNYKILEETNVKNKILKGALFIGENASGKTKVLEAIKFLLDLLLVNKDLDIITNKSLYTTGFDYELSYEFIVDNKKILYQVFLEKNYINMEKLYIDDNLIMERIKNTGFVYIEDKREVNIDLNLSLIRQEYYKTKFDNQETLIKWFDYLKNSVYINCLNQEMVIYNNAFDDIVLDKHIEKYGAGEINNFLDKLNYNTEIVIRKEFENNDGSFVINSKDEMIALKKKGSKVAIPILLESTGNKIFMNIILPIIKATKNECMLLVDEFSSGLHNDLEESLIKFFFDNSKGSQLFFVSHSTNLLDTYLLRPDQIYSFSFDAKKGTVIKRLSDEKPRESQNIEKMYLNGVFGGKPSYNKEFKI